MIAQRIAITFVLIGPISVKIKLTKDIKGEYLNLLVAGQKIPAVVKDG